MKALSGLLASLCAIGAFAVPAQEGGNVLEKRRAATCTQFSSANKILTQCQTNTAYCTNYLQRPASTSTSYTKTITTTSTPQPVTIRTTSTKTVISTVYTSTLTKDAFTPFITTTTTTSTTSVTKSETATETATKSDTLTVRTTKTETTTETDIVTIPDNGCTFPPEKRALATSSSSVAAPGTTAPPVQILAAPRPQCGMTDFGPRTVSGACGCLLDKTVSSVTTTTKVLPRSLTTLTFFATTTSTLSTLTAVTTTSTVTSTKTQFSTTTVATVTVSTVTTTAVTTTVATITSTVGTITTTETTTSTIKTAQPECTQGDINVLDDSTFVSSCNTEFKGYTADVVDATDMFDCISACTTYNNYHLEYSCVGVSFNSASCNNNCYLKQAIDTGAITPDPDNKWQSARMLSPNIGRFGNECINKVNVFGDLYISSVGTKWVLLCGQDNDVNGRPRKFYCYYTPENSPDEEESCLNACADTYSSYCTSVSFFLDTNDKYGCCARSDHPRGTYYSPLVPSDNAIFLG